MKKFNQVNGRIRWAVSVMVMVLMGCNNDSWNNPNEANDKLGNIVYSSFAESPKTLDIVKSYNTNESAFTSQIYEPILQYHYLKRPYTLIPGTATKLPEVRYLDKEGKVLSQQAEEKDIAYSVYTIEIKPNIFYQPHPAFAKNSKGEFLYHQMTAKELDKISSMSDFKNTDTRELTADDYVYQIKRIGNPSLNSPIAEVMSNYIIGLVEFENQLTEVLKTRKKKIDLREYDLEGVTVIDKYHYQIKIKGKYPQFQYWLAMPFFSPIPWEAEVFYSQPGLSGKNISFDWYPVGTGPYMMRENNPNSQMVLVKNPNFHGEKYPSEGEIGDSAKGYLIDAGKEIPFVDQVIFKLEKESIPRWNKFLQGYYDSSAISSDSFDQAVKINSIGNPELTPELKNKGIRLRTEVGPSFFYLGFNMLDSVVGGNSERAKKLRQAISIAVNYQEYINIFLNGRGIPAQGPIPPGIFGYNDKLNPITHQSIQKAKKLLAEAGYPNGYDEKTGEPLVLQYDTITASGSEEKAIFDWMRKQFAKINIQLNIRATQYNRFQDKIRAGDVQLFFWGWRADYPDPENFLFLYYGPNGKVKENGENVTNYTNTDYDNLFIKMRHMENTPQRKEIINQMIEILQVDVPGVWAFYPQDFILSHQWVRPGKPNAMADNGVKYVRIDPVKRAYLREQWNKPVLWPLAWLAIALLLFVVPVAIGYWRAQRQSYREKNK